jgi:hypothetical protein
VSPVNEPAIRVRGRASVCTLAPRVNTLYTEWVDRRQNMWRADTSEYDPRMRSCHITLIWDLLKGRYVVITTYVRTSHKITICLAFPRMRNVDGYITGEIRNIWWDITSPASFDNCQISRSLRQPATWCDFYWRAFSSRTVQREAPSLNSEVSGADATLVEQSVFWYPRVDIYINKFYIYPSPPLNENKLIQLARHVSI